MKRYLVPVFCSAMALIAGGCSSDDMVGPDNPDNGGSVIAVRCNGASVTRASNSYDDYKNLNSEFITDQSHIFLYNRNKNSLIPDFQGDNVYEYVCSIGTIELSNKYPGGSVPIPYDFNIFLPKDENKYIVVTSLEQDANDLYALDALYCPTVNEKKDLRLKRPDVSSKLLYGEIDQNQSSYKDFAQNDLMLAHDLIPASEADDPVMLTFYHVMSMVVINIEVPLDETDLFGQGFPLNSIDEEDGCQLIDRALRYTVDYETNVTSDDLMPIVTLSDVRGDVKMYRLDDPEEPQIKMREDNTKAQLYRFCALVPFEEIHSGVPFCQFALNQKKDGVMTKRDFQYIPVADQGNLELNEGYITEINLYLDPQRPEPILLSVEVLPWTRTYTVDFDLIEQ